MSATHPCCKHCPDDPAYHEDNPPDSPAIACPTCERRKIEKQAEVNALEDAARAWQVGGWSEVMLAPPVGIPSIDYAQRVTDWLRARAEAAKEGL